MNRKFIKLTVILALALILFLVGKEKGWFKRKPTGSTGIDDNADNPTQPTGSINTGTNTGNGNTGTSTTGTTKPPAGTSTGNTGTVPAHFDAKEQARKIHKLLSNWLDANGEDEQAFDIILSYSTSQIKAVNKAWSEIYLAVNGNNSLYRSIDTEVVLGRATVGAKKLQCLKKLKELGLDK